MILLDGLHFLEVIGLKLGPNCIKLLLLIRLDVDQLVPQLFFLLLQTNYIVFCLGRKPLQSVDRITQVVILFIQLFSQLSNLLLIDVLRADCLSFDGL